MGTLPHGARRDVSVASRHVSLIRPGATEAQSDDTYEVDDCFGSELGTTEVGAVQVENSIIDPSDGLKGVRFQNSYSIKGVN